MTHRRAASGRRSRAPAITLAAALFGAPQVAIALAAALLGAPQIAIAQPAPGPSSSAHAGPSQEPKAAAQALFDDAMALRKKGASAEACDKLGESLRLDPAPGTKFYLAECMEQSGKLASAWLLYTEVADAMAASGQQKREAFARERSAALAPKLARLQISVPAAARVPGLVVRRDGVTLGEAQWGFAVPVDFGAHTIEVTAPNARPFTKTVDVRAAGATVSVDVPVLAPLSGDGANACPTVAAPAPTGASGSGPLSSSGGALRTAGFALSGAGAAGLAIGGVLGGLAISKQNRSNKGPCDPARDVCTQEGLALRSDAITAATGSTIAFVAGGAMLAAGVVLLVLPAVRPAQAALVVRPGGLALEGRW